MPFYRFGPWTPDYPDTASELPDDGLLRLTVAQNVLPDSGGIYQPFQAASTIIANSLSSTCIGAFSCFDALDKPNLFAGTASTLYRIHSNTRTWSIVQTGFALTADDRWNFQRYGNMVFAATGGAPMQYMTLTATGSFTAVGGAAPAAKSLIVVRNFLVSIGTIANPQRVEWSGLDQPLSWTVDSVTQADFQDLAGAGGANTGAVVGLTGADAVIFQEAAVWRMLYVGAPLVFQLDRVEGLRGAIAPGSIVQSGGKVFYLSADGFYCFDGTTSKPIGAGKVDSWFFDTADASAFRRLSAVADPFLPIVMWSFQSVDSSQPDQILAYNWQSDLWSQLLVNCQILWRLLSYPNGLPATAIMDLFAATRTFTAGFNKKAYITTAEYQLNPAGRALITEIWPILEGPDAPRASVYHRPNPWRTLSVETIAPINATGFCPLRVDDRMVRIESVISQSASWSKWWGFRLEWAATGER